MTTKPRLTLQPGETRVYPVLPLRDIVVFPHMIVPLFVGREKSVRALEEVMRDDKQILLVTQKNAHDDDPAPDDIYRRRHDRHRAAAAEAARRHREGAGRGRERAHASTATPTRRDYYEAEATLLEDDRGRRVEAEALARSVVEQFENYVKLNKKISPEVVGAFRRSTTPRKLADTIASHLAVKIAEKEELLEIVERRRAAGEGLGLMEGEIGVLQVEKRIRTRVKRQMEKTQREYYLNEQMKAIQRELGDGEEGRDELTELEERSRRPSSPRKPATKAERELKKLRQMSPMSAEATVVRNYLDWLLVDPVGQEDQGQEATCNCAQEVLDADHYGLEKVKERILEYLAVQSARRQAEGPDPLPRRPSRRRQDLARQVDRQGDRPRVRAHVARRRARRGRDPRPPAHLHRLDARQGHPVDEEGEELQPALPARRDRQDGRRTSAAIRPRRCSRCSTRSRTRRSTTTTSRSTTTSRT